MIFDFLAHFVNEKNILEISDAQAFAALASFSEVLSQTEVESGVKVIS